MSMPSNSEILEDEEAAEYGALEYDGHPVSIG
jgi:hypothetical protein